MRELRKSSRTIGISSISIYRFILSTQTLAAQVGSKTDKLSTVVLVIDSLEPNDGRSGDDGPCHPGTSQMENDSLRIVDCRVDSVVANGNISAIIESLKLFFQKKN